MGRFDGVLIVTDFDGTVYGSKTGMPQRNIQAAEDFIAQGGTYTIATGRTYATFSPHYQIIPTNAPTILSNGASVYDFSTQEMTAETNLPETAREDLKQLCQEMPSLALELYHGGEIFAYHPNGITDEHMAIVGAHYTESDNLDIPYPWLKGLLHEEHDLLQKARERLQAIRPDTYETIFSNPRYLEVTRKGVNKGEAVKNLAKSLGISLENTYCIGDNENDLPMLACSALLVAPSSSAQVVLDLKPRLLCSCKEGVLGDLLDILSEKYK